MVQTTVAMGMFDTGQAARVLELPSRGLAYLLSHYCNVKADKRYQLADWRLRPLTPEMIGYARGDTHNLLYVYDRLKQQLAAAGAPTGRGPRSLHIHTRTHARTRATFIREPP